MTSGSGCDAPRIGSRDASPDNAHPIDYARPLGYQLNELRRNQAFMGQDQLSRLWLSADMQRVVRLVEHWCNGSAWHRDRGLSWQRNFMFYGKPGNGKSAFADSLARHFNMPIYSFDLATLSNWELDQAWQDVRRSIPAIALLEDLDAVFVGRQPTSDRIQLTFDCLLNTLDGVGGADGVLTIITTNAPETLDPALCGWVDGCPVPRPGRVDVALEFGPPDFEGRLHIARKILLNMPERALELAQQHEGTSAAVFQEHCRQAAIEQFWTDPTVLSMSG